jgi:hypothetical protein
MDATTVPVVRATIVGVDVAKSVFQFAVATEAWQVVETHRLTRTQFERWFINRQVDLVVMEACGSAHHWARWLNGLGITQSKPQWHQTLAFDAPGTSGVAYPRYGNSATDLSLGPRR